MCPFLDQEDPECQVYMNLAHLEEAIGFYDPQDYAARIVELQEWQKIYQDDLDCLEREEPWKPEVGKMVEVHDSGGNEWYPREYRGTVDEQVICRGTDGSNHIWDIARQIKGGSK